MTLQNTMLFFACASIIANYPHTYWAIDYISNVKESFMILGRWEVNPKAVQNYIFCVIISTAIMFLIFLELTNYAIAGCALEIVINCYYVYCSYEEKYSRSTDNNVRKHRKLVGAYFFAVVYPTAIITFSLIYHNL